MTSQPPRNLSPEHLLTLYNITAEMNQSLDFDHALNNIIDAVMHVTRAQRGFLVLIDENTQTSSVIAARGVDGGSLTEDGYSTTIVNEVMRTRQSLLTNNAQFDSRYQPGQSIIIRGLRAILCAPLMVKERIIGALYVDTSMRAGTFTDADRDLLSAVAGQAAIALENARLYSVAVEKGRLDRELQMASEIQQSLLPRTMPDMRGYDVAASWQAAREVAGDFYDGFPLDDDHFAVVVADVSDKGAPAALFMAVARTMIRSHAHAGLDALETIARTNDLILKDADSGMFVTVYYSLFRRGGVSTHVNAGHNPPVLYRGSERRLELMPRGGRAIGWFPDNPLKAVDLTLRAGDTLVYYTDGITDAENRHGEAFGEERLMQVIAQHGNLSARELVAHIQQAVNDFTQGEPPFDDMTLLVVRCTGN